MNWARAKTILIAVFLLLNVFLFSVYHSITTSKTEMDMKQLTQVLAKNHILLKQDIIKKIPTEIRNVELTNLAGEPQKCAERLLGEGYTTIGETQYKKGSKTLQINRSTVVLLDSAPNEPDYAGIRPEQADKKVSAVLESWGVPPQYLHCTKREYDASHHIVLTYQLRYDNLAVFNSTIQVVVGDGGIMSVQGVLLTVGDSLEMKYEIVNPRNILLELINNPELQSQEEKTITEMNLGYYIPRNDFSISSGAIPAYRISAETGKAYYYDARVNIPNAVRLLAAEAKN